MVGGSEVREQIMQRARSVRHVLAPVIRAKVAERETWAFRRVAGPDATGKERYECPAQAGKRICDLCPLSELFPNGTPKVETPPEAARPPRSAAPSAP